MFGSEDTGGDNLVNVNGNLQLSQGDGTGNDVTAADLLPDILNALDVIVEGDVVDSGVSTGADTPAQDGLTGNANVNSIGDINTGSKVPAVWRILKFEKDIISRGPPKQAPTMKNV
nr:hypothetical protein BaRGS_030134 [Batillaria attramentaria]